MAGFSKDRKVIDWLGREDRIAECGRGRGGVRIAMGIAAGRERIEGDGREQERRGREKIGQERIRG